MAARAVIDIHRDDDSATSATTPPAADLNTPFGLASFVEEKSWLDAMDGVVCIGPLGRRASGRDRQIYRALELASPATARNWFEYAYVHRFFSAPKPQKLRYDEKTRFVVYRGLAPGPGIFKKWDEVVGLTMGIQGSLFQCCQSPEEAEKRMQRALVIGGIVMEIPDHAVGAQDTEDWLRALSWSTIPPLHLPEEDMPLLPGRIPPISEIGIDEVLDGPPGLARAGDSGRQGLPTRYAPQPVIPPVAQTPVRRPA
ncbi:hypothetical protein GY45DRAFT_1375899 [Cubamyces sp. BRFM 1775]|nr:hypothetical protein GY45DRAFT_1375899 [Cubamyces sp. BRFM 1775]